MEKKKIIIAIILGIIIIGSLVFLLLYSDTAFRNETIIEYPNGCIEVYINGELNNSPCNYEEGDLNWIMEPIIN